MKCERGIGASTTNSARWLKNGCMPLNAGILRVITEAPDPLGEAMPTFEQVKRLRDIIKAIEDFKHNKRIDSILTDDFNFLVLLKLATQMSEDDYKKNVRISGNSAIAAGLISGLLR